MIVRTNYDPAKVTKIMIRKVGLILLWYTNLVYIYKREDARAHIGEVDPSFNPASGVDMESWRTK
jgi:hypothetical protein